MKITVKPRLLIKLSDIYNMNYLYFIPPEIANKVLKILYMVAEPIQISAMCH